MGYLELMDSDECIIDKEKKWIISTFSYYMYPKRKQQRQESTTLEICDDIFEYQLSDSSF